MIFDRDKFHVILLTMVLHFILTASSLGIAMGAPLEALQLHPNFFAPTHNKFKFSEADWKAHENI